MTRKQYISKLRKSLMFRLPNSEIDEIVSDMEECFEAGAAEGKSEEEIAVSLGEPKAAAASLLNEQTGGERVSKLAEMWLPLIISAGLYGVYVFCGFSIDFSNKPFMLPITCVLPLLMWVLLERRSFFTALTEYMYGFLTYFGSLCMEAAGLAFTQIPKSVFSVQYSSLQKFAVLMAVFVCIAMVLLAVSLWKNAPKFLAAIPFAGIISIIYNTARLYKAYDSEYDWKSDLNYYAYEIGSSMSNILMTMFLCAAAFLLWSFIRRSALTLGSAYCSVTVTGFVFYWYRTLGTLDPSDDRSIYLLKHITTGRNYLIWGTVIAAAVLAVTFIVKLAGGKRGG